MDPISILGLTLTVVDLLIKHGERTAVLISDARAFESDSLELRNLVQDENLQSKLLRNLLFTKRPIYGGKSLFEEFDHDIQEQIRLLSVEIESILEQGLKILERRYGVTREEPSDDSSIQKEDSSFLKITTESVSRALSVSSHSSQHTTRGRTSPGLPGRLMWSFRDKKRVETILYTFKDRNARLISKIEVWCFASQLGLSSEHLRHLQTDESSQKLGFDKDASLRLVQNHAERSMESLEILDPSWDPYYKTIEPIEHQGMFAMFTRGTETYIQENHHYEKLPTSPNAGSGIDPRTQGRVESLARLLHQPKERVFRVLPCVGWKYLPNQASIAFIFEVEPKPIGKPVSLQRLLFHSDTRPELGDRFKLALGLAKCIAQMHMVQWVHESFRSDNILLLPHNAPDGDTSSKVQTNYPEPWVLGFEFSRPEPFFSVGQADFEPSRDIYRHPDRQGQPVEMFNKIHDIYALGVVLLEIGLWEPAAKLDRNMFATANNPRAVQAQLIKHAERRLGGRIGKKYQEIVLKCLTGDFGVEDDTKEDLKLQQAFRYQVVDVIENAANFV